jgi:hypothetical protein
VKSAGSLAASFPALHIANCIMLCKTAPSLSLYSLHSKQQQSTSMIQQKAVQTTLNQ